MADATVSVATKRMVHVESCFKIWFERRNSVEDNINELHDLLGIYTSTRAYINKVKNCQLHDIGSADSIMRRRLGEYKKRLRAKHADL